MFNIKSPDSDERHENVCRRPEDKAVTVLVQPPITAITPPPRLLLICCRSHHACVRRITPRAPIHRMSPQLPTVFIAQFHLNKLETSRAGRPDDS